jgi:hypothetical protein
MMLSELNIFISAKTSADYNDNYKTWSEKKQMKAAVCCSESLCHLSEGKKKTRTGEERK